MASEAHVAHLASSSAIHATLLSPTDRGWRSASSRTSRSRNCRRERQSTCAAPRSARPRRNRSATSSCAQSGPPASRAEPSHSGAAVSNSPAPRARPGVSRHPVCPTIPPERLPPAARQAPLGRARPRRDSFEMSRLIGGTGRWQDARDGRSRHRDPVPEVPSPGAARHGSARPCARDGGGVCMQRERAPLGAFARDPLSRRRLDRPTGRHAVDGGQCRRCALAIACYSISCTVGHVLSRQ